MRRFGLPGVGEVLEQFPNDDRYEMFLKIFLIFFFGIVFV